jgi:hypothetical protein
MAPPHVKLVIDRNFMEGIVLYNLLVYAVFFSIYHAIDFEKHFEITTKAPPSTTFLAYFSFLTHANAMCSEVTPRTEFGRTLVGLHVLFSWGLFLVLLAPWSSIPTSS